ncbi:MAG TPA: FMN-binding protein, partial [Helicobacteraceae bacterium]|nr:FMN-binding protein [Helicobacteraceae bacterium]
LFMINPKGVIESVETVAFNEPPEFIPNATWTALFLDKNSDNTLRVGKDIPTISGATLTARGYADGSRLALAIYNVVLKEK